ncbi:hypothetical protein FBUS_01625 [Fasciolopsis buskii]|uniref:Uncharacterized protein n=1 Tax=Fasciolopsis buskii TaxID=27845 RepID=A0A8E0RZ85_9TREM|nr:hypothetical protein FBUS_01625 [Fasciolopsis buski]
MVTDETSSSLNASVCYSGLVKCFADLDYVNTLGFWGATFGQVVIRADYFRFTASGRLIHDNHSELQTLHCQKGVIFSLDLCVLAQSNQCNLVSAAEDRSIAVWTTVLKTVGDDDDDVTKFRGPWELLYRLDGGAPAGDVIFQSRIRMVVASSLGMLAVGEDCRIVWYPWSAISEMKVINGTHRGHGIWCADLRISQTSGTDDAILVSGGNDGAVCVQSLRLAGQSELEVLNSQDLPDLTKSESLILTDSHTSRRALLPSPDSDEDFPRSIFFGPEGRLFYLTNMGRMYMAAVSVDCSKPTSSHVQPYFRESIVNTVLYNRCYDRSLNPLLLTSASTHPSLSGLFSGYSVCSTNVDHTLLAIGDRAGRVYLFQFLNDHPYLVCTDFICLDQKLMKLIWLGADLLMVATRGGSATLLRVQRDTVPALFISPFVTLTLPVGLGMRWINTGCLCPVSSESEELMTHPVILLVVGTRDGGLYLFRVNWSETSDSSVSPVWSLEACHGRGGCTAVLCFPLDSSSNTSLVISCGRTHGELRCWTANSIQGTLLLRSLIPNSAHLTWVERFHAIGDGRLFALGFQSVSGFNVQLIFAVRFIRIFASHAICLRSVSVRFISDN